MENENRELGNGRMSGENSALDVTIDVENVDDEEQVLFI